MMSFMVNTGLSPPGVMIIIDQLPSVFLLNRGDITIRWSFSIHYFDVHQFRNG